MQNETNAALSQIHHVAIGVADIKKSMKWYMTSFECRVIYESPREAVLQFANIRLSLVLPSHEPPHVAFERDDAATLGELRERNDDIWSTFLADPTGNVIEVVGPRLVVDVPS